MLCYVTLTYYKGTNKQRKSGRIYHYTLNVECNQEPIISVQRKVVSDSPGLVYFAIGLLDSVLELFGEFK